MPVIVENAKAIAVRQTVAATAADCGTPLRLKSSKISQKRRPRKSISSIIGPEKLARRIRCGGGTLQGLMEDPGKPPDATGSGYAVIRL